jgi:hypothetical protein
MFLGTLAVGLVDEIYRVLHSARRSQSVLHTYLSIGYGDETGYALTDPAVRDRAHAHDARLAAEGAVIGVAGTPCAVAHGVVEVWPLVYPSTIRAPL